MGQHLNLEDYIQYINTEELGDEYINRIALIEEHLASCDECSVRLQKIINTDTMCDDDLMPNAFSLLTKEESIRTKYVLLKMMEQNDEFKKKGLAALMNAVLVMKSLSSAELNRPHAAWRGVASAMLKTGEFETSYAKNILTVSVRINTECTVVLKSGNSYLFKTTEWDEETRSQKARFKITDPEQNIEICILNDM